MPDEDELIYDDAIAARRRANLERARAVRERNAVVRKLLKDKEIDAQRLIAGTLDRTDPVEGPAQRAADTWKIPAVLKAVPGMGEATTFAVLASMPVSPNVKLGALRQARREQLARLVGVALARR